MFEYYMLQINHLVIMADLLRKYLVDYPKRLPEEIKDLPTEQSPELIEALKQYS